MQGYDYHADDPATSQEVNKVLRNYSRIVFERQEHGQPHNPYEQEVRETSAIEQGDVAMLRRSFAEEYSGTIGHFSTNELRQYQDLSIVVIALASRAAIRGGMPPEMSFSMSDAFIQRIEEMNDPGAILNLLRRTEIEYAERVAEIRSNSARPNMWAEQCKAYIFQHLHEKITTRDIAAHLHLNANYLSEIFRQCENMTITEFILREKVALTRNLLTYSPYSYIEIATYLGFSSQSHLGKVFKQYTGMTLRQYRTQFGREVPDASEIS